MAIISKLLGLGSKALAKKSDEAAKAGTDLIGRRAGKYMGEVEDVATKRLGSSVATESAKKGSNRAALLTNLALIDAVTSSSGKEETTKREEPRGRSFQEERPVRDAGRIASAKAEAASAAKTPSTFGAAFKQSRASGDKTFMFEGKKYTTELAEEKKAASSPTKPSGVREGRNENIDDNTRNRAMESVSKLAKGGMVVNKGIGASMKAHNGFTSKGKK